MSKQDFLNNPSLYKSICSRYEIGEKIGEGSYGKIYKGCNLYNKQQIALKFESKDCYTPQLKQEYFTYRSLKGSPGVSNVHYFGHEKYHHVLVMDLFGPSLEDMFNICNKKFSVKTVTMLAIEMLTVIEGIHKRNFIHRDIKPDNFLINTTTTTTTDSSHKNITIIDFGMAKQYRDSNTHEHIPYRERKRISGTARYMSIHMHLGNEQSRRDDLESLGYVLIYFLKGQLPWQGIHAQSIEEKYNKICKMKQSSSPQVLCAGLPEEFVKYMQYVRAIGFSDEPNYSWLIELFKKLMGKLSEEKDKPLYDWMLLCDGWETLLANERLEKKKPLLLLPPPPPISIQKEDIDQVEDITQNNVIIEDDNAIHNKKWNKMKNFLHYHLFKAE
ncbi:kinase-like domain-containing protein [Cokeromyces recurvatus]|uniref:kinase-like domain-containing protein n=1 Tax=Cokeromyces recurvatus TaxID=90255 RepID=UPI00221F4312|nr:kinase-like domain-containing protein [Cokeromyces recurvatus]KAI7898975.1 kinase-like domain-containing protein [Cokeromyces recurvatus]